MPKNRVQRQSKFIFMFPNFSSFYFPCKIITYQSFVCFRFEGLYNICNTVGAVDGTHIAISKPPMNHPTAPGSLFYNRKGFYSINCQIVRAHLVIIIYTYIHLNIIINLKLLCRFVDRHLS